MYTETELREALQFSAARADALSTEKRPGDATVPSRRGGELIGLLDSRRPSSHRVWLPAVAAAAVVGVLGAAVFATSGNSGGSKRGAASAPPSVSAAVIRPRTAVALGNLITITETDGNGYEFGPADRPQVRTVGGDTAVIALPPSTPFDATAQITDAQRVQVAGTTGYYGRVAANVGNPTGDPGKYGAPKTTLAWRAANGTWVFIQGENHDVNLSLSTLLARYQQLGITVTPAPLPRLPYRAGWVPDGLTVTSLAWEPSGPENYLSDVTLTAGTNSVEITVSQGRPTTIDAGQISVHGHLPAPDPHAARTVGDTRTTVVVHGFAQATAQKVLDNLDLSRLHGDRATWWTVTGAFSG